LFPEAGTGVVFGMIARNPAYSTIIVFVFERFTKPHVGFG